MNKKIFTILLMLSFIIQLNSHAAYLNPYSNLSQSDTIFLGENAYDQAGSTVSALGDINGDGLNDFVIGAPDNNQNGKDAGKIYIFFGNLSGWESITSLSTADASYLGERPQSSAGSSVAGVGDVNNDGFDDFLIGAPGDDENGSGAGQTYLIFGKQIGWSKDTPLSSADASFLGENPEDESGSMVAGTGDLNGDNIPDILINAPASISGTNTICQAYLIFGKSSGWATDTSLSVSDASFVGLQENNKTTCAVAGTGDVNADGFNDFLVSEHTRNFTDYPNGGETYLIYGKTDGWAMRTSLASADASFIGEGLGNWAGHQLSGAGDVNGDGFDDFLIGAPGDDDHGRQSGEAYLILGNSTGWSVMTNLGDVDASFRPEWFENWVGRSIASIGDLNKDGLDDFIIGAPKKNWHNVETINAYIIWGSTTGWAQNSELIETQLSFLGVDGYDEAGEALSGIGDVNGDGWVDILIGARKNDAAGDDAGAAYLILGGDQPSIGDFSADSPWDGEGVYHTFSASYYDQVDGWEDVKFASMVIKGSESQVEVRYIPSSNKLRMKENNSPWLGQCKQGNPGTIVGTFMELDCENTTIFFVSSSELRVGWRMRVLQPPAQRYNLRFQLQVMDLSNNISTNTGGLWVVDPATHDFDLGQVLSPWDGEGAYNQAGWSTAYLGDVNGDGFGDLAVGAPLNGELAWNAGQVYLFFGSGAFGDKGLTLTDADASFLAQKNEDYAGISVAGAGDVNNDGYDDILIGAYNSTDSGTATAGEAYLILGKPSGWILDDSLDNADASFLAEGGSNFVGYDVSSAGDVNGDGYDDILIGAWGAWSDQNERDSGKAYLVFGKSMGWQMDTSLTLADASFNGETGYDRGGFSVAKVGDVNNDGFDDFLISSPMNDEFETWQGQAYLFLGKPTGWAFNMELSQADASFLGEDSNDMAGFSVTGVGDVNNDGYDDFTIGAIGDEQGGGQNAGQVYLILGKSSGWAMDTFLSTADASFLGENGHDKAGTSVSSLGDINADGFSDFAISAPGNDDGGWSAGKIYVILGKNSGWALNTRLSRAFAAYWGEEPGDNAGISISGVLNASGPGSVNLIVGAPGFDALDVTDTGRVYNVPLR